MCGWLICVMFSLVKLRFFRQESLYACDYSQSHFDYMQWQKAVDSGTEETWIGILHCT